MQGYYKNQELTNEVIDEEGWFHTGDIGQIEPGGQLRITDRKKVIFKTSFGKYISPQVIENIFKESSFIDQILVIGENQRFAMALIVPDFNHLKSWCEVKGIQYTSNNEIINTVRIRKRIQKEVNLCNQRLGEYERIMRFGLVDHEWTVEGGQLSATLKLRRQHLLKEYDDLIQQLYNKCNGKDD
jgi:long-chain acyl-CoA synthetase